MKRESERERWRESRGKNKVYNSQDLFKTRIVHLMIQ